MSTTEPGRRVSGVSTRFTARGNACPTDSRLGRRCMSLLRSLWAIAVALLSVSAASAAPLAPPQLAADVLFNLDPPGRISTDRFGTTSLADPGFGAVSFTASGTPSPSLVANAAIGPSQTPSIFGRADGILNYGIEVVGPAGPVPVLIDVAGAAAASAPSGASFAVESRWDLLDFGSPLVGDDIRSGQLSGSFSQNFDHRVSLTLVTNHAYTVFMLADAAAAATLEGSQATATAFIDPIFSLGLGVDPQSYTFVLSEGIGNARPTALVPEPETPSLLGAVFLALVILRRRRLNLLAGPAMAAGNSAGERRIVH